MILYLKFCGRRLICVHCRNTLCYVVWNLIDKNNNSSCTCCKRSVSQCQIDNIWRRFNLCFICVLGLLQHIDMYSGSIQYPIIRSLVKIRPLPTYFIFTMKRIIQPPLFHMHDTQLLSFIGYILRMEFFCLFFHSHEQIYKHTYVSYVTFNNSSA